MADRGLERLAEAQRETARAIETLVERYRLKPLEGGASERAGPEEGDRERLGGVATLPSPLPASGLERGLEAATRSIGELTQATTESIGAMGGLGRELNGLPGVLATLAGGVKGGGSGLGSPLKSGLGLTPLWVKIAGLFRGRGEEPQPPAPYLGPPPLELEVANTGGILAGLPRVVRGVGGEPRAVEHERAVVWQPQVTVNVSAMDSRSFLDRQEDIARAVREAMLHMHPVNDLISEL